MFAASSASPRHRKAPDSPKAAARAPTSQQQQQPTPYVVYVDPKTGNVVGAQHAGSSQMKPQEATAAALQLLGGLSSAATVNRFGDKVSAETLLQLAGANKGVGRRSEDSPTSLDLGNSPGAHAGPQSPTPIRHSLYKVRKRFVVA